MAPVQAQFTEDLLATHQSYCKRQSCQAVILKGQYRFYVRNKLDLNLPGNLPQEVSGTVSRGDQIDVREIRQNANESQHRSAHTPQGRTTAIPVPRASSSQMGPTSGIHTSAPWNSSGPSGGTSSGYSAAHEMHGQETRRWAAISYKGNNGGILGSSANQLTLNLEVYQLEFDNKGLPIFITNIKESIKVADDILDYHLAHTICHSLHQSLVSKLMKEIPFNINNMVVRETSEKTWFHIQDEERYAAPYFGNCFFIQSKRKSDHTPTFTHPRKPLVFGLVIESEIWDKIQQREDMRFLQSQNVRLDQSMGPPSVPVMSTRSTKRKGKGKEREKAKRQQRRKSISSNSGDQKSDSGSDSGSQSDRTPPRQVAPSCQHLQQCPQEPTPTFRPPTQTKTSKAAGPSSAGSTVAQAIVVDSDGSDAPRPANHLALSLPVGTHSFVTQSQPPRSISSKLIRSGRQSLPATTSFVYTPLDAQTIREGFQKGGASAKKRDPTGDAVPFIFEHILFFQLPELSFRDLIGDPGQAIFISVQPGTHFNGNLTYNPKDTLGKGSFKTAVAASLEFDGTHTPTTGLGSVTINSASAVSVALKRPFVPAAPTEGTQQSKLRSKPGPKVVRESRLTYADEQQAITGEAKLLVWGNSLLNFAYSFIFDFIEKSGQGHNLPPFIDNLPTFRFVQAGVAIVPKDVVEKSKTPSSHRAVYLLEEMLPGERSDFVKYVNNSKAVSLIAHDKPDFELADFLTFIQHVQYQITHKQAYLSDFQGVSTTLTDPQIMTSPTLGPNLFGGGNLGESFENFPIEHGCNEYCSWSQLKELV